MANDGDIVAVGEVAEHKVSVIYRRMNGESRYVWTATLDGKINKTDGRDYMSIEKAIHGAIEYLDDGSAQAVLVGPSEEDFEHLNLLLAGSTDDHKIETLIDAIMVHQTLVDSVTMYERAQHKAADDLDTIHAVLVEARGPFSNTALNCIKLKEILLSQQAVLTVIAARDRDILAAFLSQFLQ